MISLRENLAKIGIGPGTLFSYRNSFSSRPSSLREAIRSMNAPQYWQQVSDIPRDDFWVDEVQGVAWDGSNWIFSCNANQSKPDVNDKSIYVFRGGQSLADNQWICRIAYKDVPHPIAGLYESDDHWGQVTVHNGFVYVSHFWSGGPKQGQSNVVVFKNSGGILQYHNWIALEQVTSSDGRTGFPEFQAINPWDGKFYSCLGGEEYVREFYVHSPDSGLWEGKKSFRLSGLLPRKVQGACFSDNGHLYVAVDCRFTDWGLDYKWIFYYSALNGSFLGKIPVLAKEDDQELEGICFAATSFADGRIAQIHAVLLENRNAALDNIFFKSFSADLPEAV